MVRQVAGIAIDDEGTRVCEQGVMLRCHPSKPDHWRLEVSVVDATAQIFPQSAVDRVILSDAMEPSVARIRARRLAPANYAQTNGFKQSLPVPAITLFVDISPDGEIGDTHFERTEFTLLQPLTYSDFDRKLAQGEPSFNQWHDVFMNLQLPFNLDQGSGGGYVSDVVSRLANHAAGAALSKINAPALYMCWRDARKNAPDLQVLPHRFVETIPASQRRMFMYQTSPCAEGEKQYARISGPLRNACDFFNQRLLLALIDNTPTPYTPEQITQIAALANEALLYERKSILLDAWRKAQKGGVPAVSEQQLIAALEKGDYKQEVVASIHEKTSTVATIKVVEALMDPSIQGSFMHAMTSDLILRFVDDPRRASLGEELVRRLPRVMDDVNSVSIGVNDRGPRYGVFVNLRGDNGDDLQRCSFHAPTISEALARACARALEDNIFPGIRTAPSIQHLPKRDAVVAAPVAAPERAVA
jgi:hypothetical protein